MANESLKQHLGNDEVLGYLYAGAGSDERVAQHLSVCPECRQHIEALSARRLAVESEYRPEDEVSFEFLAAQRRQIYARIEHQEKTGWLVGVRRWATAAGLAVAIAGGVAVYEQHSAQPEQPKISDAQLASEVGQFAEDTTPQPAQPITTLFEEQ